jgi:hypothetical protein
MQKWLDFTAAFFALIAAAFWFLSAYGKLPPIVTYWGQTPQGDPFYQVVTFSAAMNRWAAGFSGASALSMAASLSIRWKLGKLLRKSGSE